MRTAIYPGSFDPVTFGHIDIIKRALKLFDRLIIVVLTHYEKKPLFSVDERVDMLKEATAGLDVEIDRYDGLTVDYTKKRRCSTIIRSLRAVSDFDYEFQMAVMNRTLSPDIETVFLMTEKDYFFLNSSIVKELSEHRADISHLVPEHVAKMLVKKFRR